MAEIESPDADAAQLALQRRTLSYQVVADALRDHIRQNAQASAQRLPTEAELSARYGVSRGTVRRAYLDLVSEGLVERVPGRGSFPVRRDPYRRTFGTVDELLALSEDTPMEVVLPFAAVSDPDAAAALGLQFDDVYRVTYIRLHDSSPFCYTEVFVPPRLKSILLSAAFLRAVGARSDATILGILDRDMSSPVAGARQAITAVPAPADIAVHIGAQEGDPVLRIERVHFDSEGRPVERCVNHFNPDRYVYRLQLSRG